MARKRSSNGNTPIRILLVDDHRDMQKTLADILELEPDFKVIGTARDGLQAIAQASTLKPDIILMNYSMPMMDGITATRRITRQTPDAVIIMVSFYDDPNLIDAAFKAGAQGFVVKPIQVFDELYSTLRLAYQMRAARKRVRETRETVAMSHAGMGKRIPT